ncbi:MAG: VWA domain-containing protein, partial [Saprospiraceae bacterium]
VGLVLFSDKVELYIPPKKGKQHILRIIRELLVDRPECMTTNYKIPLEYINSIISKRSICFIISDFFEPIPDTSLKILCKRHDVIGIQIQDPIEKKIAAIGILSVKDLESNKEFLIDTNQNEYSNSLEKQSTKMIETTRLQFSRANAEFLVIDDLSNYIKSLLRFFKMRQKR